MNRRKSHRGRRLLTGPQMAMLQFISDSLDHDGLTPTINELVKGTGHKLPAVHRMLETLEKKRFVDWPPPCTKLRSNDRLEVTITNSGINALQKPEEYQWVALSGDMAFQGAQA